MSLVALIDYGSGNLRSAEKAIARAAVERGLAREVVVTSDPAVAAKAARIVLPGVGAFADCMGGLTRLPGMVEALREAVLVKKVPFLGICVGMQLLASVGREFGDHKGLGWIPGEVVHLTPSDPALKIPHMGWNELRFVKNHILFADLDSGAHAYFVHSYCFKPTDRAHLLGTTEYGSAVAAVIGRENIVGTQFHPEKSQAMGLSFLGNFLEWAP